MNLKSDKSHEVSIAICTYNGDKYLDQQLDSILNQTYGNIAEIVCVDDGSQDDTIKILKDYQQFDARIKIFENETNLGYIRNFERALILCSNDYIALADQDDLWYPEKIERLMNAIGDNLMVYSDSDYIDEQNRKIGKKMSDFRRLRACNSCLNLALFNGISGHAMIVRKELIKMTIPFSLKIPHDYWMAFFAAQYGSMAYVDESLVGYRQHTGNSLGGIGMGKKSKIDKWFEVYERLTIFAVTIKDAKLSNEKHIIELLADKYIHLTLKKRVEKVILFLKYRDKLLVLKKRNDFRKMIYCFKMFWRAI
jgi:glycosyltransferase involved in cell wall biosynthesis